MSQDIPDATYKAIEKQIADANSPVGIDAKQTHILILHKLTRIEERLDALERRLERDGNSHR